MIDFNLSKNYEYTYRWEISVWFHNDAEWNAGVFARFVSAWNPVRSAPHQRLVRIKKRIVNSRFLNYLLLLLNLLLFERLLHGIVVYLCLLLATSWTRMHICILILSWSWLVLMHLSLWLLTEWLSVYLSGKLIREQKLTSIDNVKASEWRVK